MSNNDIRRDGMQEGDNQQTVQAPTINISRVVVYNFSRPIIETPKKAPAKPGPLKSVSSKGSSSDSNNSGALCRICLEGEKKEPLVGPCLCKGSSGQVHLTCIERWLSSANKDFCEICHYKFPVNRSFPTFKQWACTSNPGQRPQSLMSDIICFILLGPLATVSVYLCVDGALKGAVWERYPEATCLMALAVFLAVVFTAWAVVASRYHYKNWKLWQFQNQIINLQVSQLVQNNSPQPSVSSSPSEVSTDESSVFIRHSSNVDTPTEHFRSFELVGSHSSEACEIHRNCRNFFRQSSQPERHIESVV